ncbi:ABC transporter permease [Phytohabitans rumicis]|uniref:ABC transporter permease n=1 Tax=Phytohabitans rumicis TaxID=1076125 RepID=UPI0035306F5E
MAVFGRHTFAIGSNPEAASRAGINVKRHLLKVYIIGGTAAGFAGFLSLAYFSTTSIGGHSTDNLQAITAVALGGTSLFGASARSSGPSSGCGSRRCSRTASSSRGSSPTGRTSRWAWCSSSPSGSTSSAVARATGAEAIPTHGKTPQEETHEEDRGGSRRRGAAAGRRLRGRRRRHLGHR